MNKKVIKMVLDGNYKKLILLGIFILLNSLLSIIVSHLILLIIDNVIPQEDINQLLASILIYLLVILIQLVISFSSNYMSSVFLLETINSIRIKIVNSIISKKGPFLSSMPKGELYSAIDSDSSTICSFVVENIFSIIHTICTFVVTAIYLGILNWKLLIIILLIQPIAIIIQIKLSPKITEFSKENRDYIAEYSSSLQDVIGSPIELKLSGFKHFIINKFNSSMNGLLNATKKLFIITSINDHIVELVNSITLCAVIAFSGFSIINHTMSIGMLIVFITQSGKLTEAFSKLLEFSMDFSEIIPIIDRVNKYAFDEDSSDKVKTVDNTNETPNKRDIEFKNVSFSYDGQKNIYEKMNVKFSYGKNYGIVGRTGEGKSSFVKLVYALWKPEIGTVSFGGIPVDKLNEDIITKITAYVSSDPMFIKGTIKENLLMGNEGTDEEICTVLEKVCMLDEVKSMDNGIDTIIGDDGTTLSSGQRQRLALARAILRKKPVTILDEPTSALDDNTEKIVMKNIYNEFENDTLIIITHDMSILYECDDVYRLENKQMKKEKFKNIQGN